MAPELVFFLYGVLVGAGVMAIFVAFVMDWVKREREREMTDPIQGEERNG